MILDHETEKRLATASRKQLLWLLHHRDTLQAASFSPFGSLHALSARHSFVIERSGRVTTRKRGRPGASAPLRIQERTY